METMVEYDDKLRDAFESEQVCTALGITPTVAFWRQAVRNGQISAAEAYRISGVLPFTNDEIENENLRLRGEGVRA